MNKMDVKLYCVNGNNVDIIILKCRNIKRDITQFKQDTKYTDVFIDINICLTQK